jgi:hypothetical protein
MEPGQIQITRDDGTTILLHHGIDRFATIYRVKEFEPYDQFVRADQTGTVPWGDGNWSGAEWKAQPTIPMRLRLHTASEAALMSAWWPLRAALAPVGTGGDVELTWNVAGTEYLMYVRPGDTRLRKQGSTGLGVVTTQMVAPDPAVYSAVEHTTEIGLLHRIGGLSTPFGLPTSIYSVVADGEATLVNAGTAPARLLLRITGPLTAPSRITVIHGTSVETLNLDTLLGPDDYLDIDTKDKLVVLNGSVTRLPDQWGAWPLLPPGESLLRFESDVYQSAARLIIRHRDTW